MVEKFGRMIVQVKKKKLGEASVQETDFLDV